MNSYWMWLIFSIGKCRLRFLQYRRTWPQGLTSVLLLCYLHGTNANAKVAKEYIELQILRARACTFAHALLIAGRHVTMAHSRQDTASIIASVPTMRVKRCHTRLLVLLHVVVNARGFTNPPLLPSHLTRGGDNLQDDAQIDQYIEDLIATVDSSSESSSEDVRDDIEVDVDVEKVDQEGREITMDGASDDAEDENDLSDAPVETFEEEKSTKEIEDLDNDELRISLQVEGNEEVDDNEATSDSNETPKRTKRRKKRNASGDQESQDGQASGEEDSQSKGNAVPLSERAVGPSRPNALYRFLLNQGRIGHIFVLICVLITELITTYIPPLARLLAFIFSFILPSDRVEGGSASFGRGPRDPLQKVNEQYAAFVTSDGSSVRGIQRKKHARKADEQAAEKLRRVGSIQDAKFRHVSVDFMHRHGIGSYRDSEKSEDIVVYQERGAMTKSAGGDEEESDVDWVVEALSTEQEKEEATRPIETSFGVGLGSDGATISVGVQFGASNKSRKKKRQSTLAEAAFERTPLPKRKPAGPRTSDRDGGGGVIGRIRAAGANSLMSRSLLGAYPGDAVPPSEAGSANGVTALAEKYGYGDWSDDEESDDDDFEVESSRRKVKKKRNSKKHKRRKPSSPSGVSFQFGMSSSSESSRKTTTPKRPSSTSRRHEDSAKTSISSTNRFDILTGQATSSLPERKRVEVRPPMEKLNFATEKAKRRKDED